METDLQELEKALVAVDQYDRDTRDEEDASLRELAEDLDPLVRELDRLDTEYQTHLRATKGNFNLFTALLKPDDEVRLHSRWIEYLLNPKAGRHDCGSLFLKLFLEQLRTASDTAPAVGNPSKLDELTKLNLAVAVAHTEYSFDNGRIDILIEFPGWGAIAIENKIGAGDGEDQIHKYAEYLKQEYTKKGQSALLLYLTPDGRSSATAKGLDQYSRISYSQHILDWLDECLRQTYQYVNINQALQQYRNVVHQISEEVLPLEKLYMEKIMELVERHPAIIKHYAKLGPAIEKLRKKTYAIFWKEVNEHLANNNIRVGEVRTETDSGGYDYWRVSIIDEQGQPDTGLLTIFFDRGKDFYICAWTQADADKLDREFKEKMAARWPDGVLRKGYNNTRACVELPEAFTEKGLSEVVGNPSELRRRATMAAEIIARYVKEAKNICPKLFRSGERK